MTFELLSKNLKIDFGSCKDNIKKILPGIEGNTQIYFDPEDGNIARGAAEGNISIRRVKIYLCIPLN